MTGKAAFVVGAVRFAKQAGLDQDDAGELVRILLMPPKTALPILKSANHVRLARQYAEAGRTLVSLDLLVKTAFNGIASSVQSPYQQWTGMAQGGRPQGGSAVTRWLGMEQAPTDSGNLSEETDEQMWQRLWEKGMGSGRSVGATPPGVNTSTARAAIRAERRRISTMTAQQMREEAEALAMPEAFKGRLTAVGRTAGMRSVTQAKQRQQYYRDFFRRKGMSYAGIDPEKMNPALFPEAERETVRAAMREAREMGQSRAGLTGQSGFAAFGQGGLSDVPAGVKAPGEPIGGAGGQSSPTGTAGAVAPVAGAAGAAEPPQYTGLPATAKREPPAAPKSST